MYACCIELRPCAKIEKKREKEEREERSVRKNAPGRTSEGAADFV